MKFHRTMRAVMLDETLRERLAEMFPGGVLFDEPLSCYTSMGVGGKADAIVFPKTQDELSTALREIAERGLSFLPMGNGTNLIVRDGGYRGVVISLKGLRAWAMEEAMGNVCLRAEAGLSLAELVTLSLQEGLRGMEFCAGIPGTVGGAIRMNAGAYGREMADVLESVTIIRNNGDLQKLQKEELNFGYRNLAVPADSLILAATFSLLRGERTEVRKSIEKILALRKEKHPLMYRNAGSIFKNPRDGSAGRIIDELGIKGLTAGGAKISELHGNFIVNMGEAKASDVLTLIDRVKEKVLAERGIVLETEVNIIGDEI